MEALDAGQCLRLDLFGGEGAGTALEGSRDTSQLADGDEEGRGVGDAKVRRQACEGPVDWLEEPQERPGDDDVEQRSDVQGTDTEREQAARVADVGSCPGGVPSVTSPSTTPM